MTTNHHKNADNALRSLKDDTAALNSDQTIAYATAEALLAIADELRATRQATHPDRPAWDLDTETVAGIGTNYYTQDGQPATTAQVREYLDHQLGRDS